MSRSRGRWNPTSPLKVCWVIRPSTSIFPIMMPTSPAFTMSPLLMMRVLGTLNVPQLPHHLMVLVAQHPRQEEWGFISAPSFKASPRPPFPVDGDVPLPPDSGSTLAAAAACSRWQGLLCEVLSWCIGVVPQLMDPFHKFTLLVENLLGKGRGEKEWPRCQFLED